jgi:Ulp1 family protease
MRRKQGICPEAREGSKVAVIVLWLGGGLWANRERAYFRFAVSLEVLSDPKDFGLRAAGKLAELMDEETIAVHALLDSDGVGTETLVYLPSGPINRDDLRTCRHGYWLNDNIVNAFMALINLRASAGTSAQRVFAFTSFFLVHAQHEESKFYENVRKWSDTAGVVVNDLDLALFPVHVDGTHWFLASIDFVKKQFCICDSFGKSSHSSNILRKLRAYVVREGKMYSGFPANFSLDAEWKDVYFDGPQQQNGFDCGVFMCVAADFLSEGMPVTLFSQANMRTARLRIVRDIMRKRLDSST